MAEAKTHSGVVLSNFRDATTGVRYTKGDTHTFDAGAFLNYSKAGLVAKPSKAPSEAPKTDAKSRA